MNCSKCGLALPAGVNFSPNCGEPAPAAVTPSLRILEFSQYIAERTRDFTGRERVFWKVDAWLADSKAQRIFLLVGGPGTGKSALAARLTQMSLGEVRPDSCPGLVRVDNRTSVTC
jgi:hypothetical protein